MIGHLPREGHRKSVQDWSPLFSRAGVEGRGGWRSASGTAMLVSHLSLFACLQAHCHLPQNKTSHKEVKTTASGDLQNPRYCHHWVLSSGICMGGGCRASCPSNWLPTLSVKYSSSVISPSDMNIAANWIFHSGKGLWEKELHIPTWRKNTQTPQANLPFKHEINLIHSGKRNPNT